MMKTTVLWNLSEPQLLLLGFVLASVCFTFGAWLLIKWRNQRRRKQLRRRFEHGVRAEAKVETILQRHGFEVLGLQSPLKLEMWVDGEPRSYLVRPDAVAQRQDQTFFVEMKTGRQATNPLSRDTRRQMMEYYYGAPVDGVLFVNGDEERVHQIHFGGRAGEVPLATSPRIEPEPSKRRPLRLILGMVILLALVIVFLVFR